MCLAGDKDSISEYEKALMSFELDGLSLGLNESELKSALINNGYTLGKKQDRPKGAIYWYKKKVGKKWTKVNIRVRSKSGIINVLAITIPNDGDKEFVKNKKH